MEIAVSPFFLFTDTNLGAATKYLHSEEEDPEDYPFPLTLRSSKKSTPSGSPNPGVLNGVS